VELAQQAHQREKSAEGVVLASLELPLRTTLHRLLGSDHDIDDLLQDVWAQVFRSLPSYRGRAELVSWAERIAVRTTLRYLQRQSRQIDAPFSSSSQRDGEGLGSFSGAARAALPEPNADAREALRRLLAILAALPPRYRVAFILYEFEGKSLRDIATTMGSSLPATKSRILRARRRIAKSAQVDELLRPYVASLVAKEPRERCIHRRARWAPR
jgi:RNA polymerase sigma-70 factor (ECF subfamily)